MNERSARRQLIGAAEAAFCLMTSRAPTTEALEHVRSSGKSLTVRQNLSVFFVSSCSNIKENKKLSYRRYRATLRVIEYFARSLNVIRNDTPEYCVCKSLLVFHWNYVSRTRGHMTPPLLHACNGLARPTDEFIIIIIIIIITDLYSALRSEDTEALDAAQED